MLSEVVRRLAGEFDPDQIILFGSYAWGGPSEDSDVDMLVIVPKSDLRATLRARRVSCCLRGLKIPAGVIVRTRGEMDGFVRVPASLESEALERGRVIYGRGEEGTGPRLAKGGYR